MRYVFAAVLIAALASSVWAGSSLIHYGMRGTDVKEIQQMLVDLGHELVVDGVFGPKTKAAVMQVQKDLGLRVDGVVGPETRAALAELREAVVSYTVQRGDNLTAIAMRYQTTVDSIVSYNNLDNPHRLLPGQVLLIPTSDLPVFGSVLYRLGGMIWPVQGRISSGYGYRTHPVTKVYHFHGGIDIAVAHGTPVRAALAGKVVKAGNLGGLGLAIVIDHGNEITTWYGHNSALLVRVGDYVQQGQVIARSGRTGVATGPHLDFRIKIRDQTVDPLKYLP
ncbi:MAG: peptidoglycan DD-metalloendopeptidase family protein [Bacillota bacterium]|jgi:LysM repeat protein|nr:peptidoglycan DD-metalloendopeptidase family protein [Bacillota bacterium]